ncbi:MAG: hypothetical protein LBM98_04995, partial [Oscillospiraceae bacterium]|nr:hypothetical protein [Oscillospiraceae bacterium]
MNNYEDLDVDCGRCTFPVQPHVLIPSVEGCRPQAAGWFPPQGVPRPTQPTCAPLPKPPSLESARAASAA